MRKSVILALVFPIALIMSGCNGLKKMQENSKDVNYSVNPEVLELKGGNVEVNITGNYPEKYFDKKVTATATPYLVWNGGEQALSPVTIQGEKVEGNGKVIQYKSGGKFSYHETIKYKPEMRRSHLELRIDATRGKKSATFDPYKIAEGVVATPELAKLKGETAAANDKFVKDIEENKAAKINYDKNKADLKNSETKKDEIVALKDYIKEVNDNARKDFVSLELSSYASPEGTQELNDKVSKNRSKTADSYVKKEFKGIEDFKKANFIKETVTKEDWDGFKTAVSGSNLKDKDMILRVVNMNSDVDKREAEIRNMQETFVELEELIHPLLRRSEIKVNVMLIGHTDSEIDSIFNADPSKLSVEEFLYLGKLTNDDNKKLSIYTKASETYPRDWRCLNNLATVQYNKGDYAGARVSVEKAKSIQANATVLNNLGNICLAEGKLDEAQTNYEAATGVTEASSGQGVIAIKKGNYQSAVEHFGETCSANAALAKLLNGDNDGAVKAAGCGNDKEDALNYYLKAIAGARKSDSDMLFNNLRTACSKDSSLKAFAADDVEFIKFFDNDTFKTIVK